MNLLRLIWPMLGEKSPKVCNKNPSWTKKGPGRRHQHLTAKEVAARAAANMAMGAI